MGRVAVTILAALALLSGCEDQRASLTVDASADAGAADIAPGVAMVVDLGAISQDTQAPDADPCGEGYQRVTYYPAGVAVYCAPIAGVDAGAGPCGSSGHVVQWQGKGVVMCGYDDGGQP